MIENVQALVDRYATRVRDKTSVRRVEVSDTIRRYDVRPVPWSRRETAREDLAA